MGTKHEASRIEIPDASGTPGWSELATYADAQATDLMPLGSYFQPEDQIYPLPAASPAPLLTDGGITDGAPSPTTGLRFIPWTDTSAYNYQGMAMAISPSLILTSVGASSGFNAPTPRIYGFGDLSTTLMGGTIDLRFDTDAARIVPMWYNFNGYTLSSYHDQHTMVSDRGVMKHLSSTTTLNGLPRSVTTGAGTKKRDLTFNERRWKTVRVILPGYAHFIGVWIDQYANIRKPANKPLFFLHNGDSWNEPLGAAWDGGNQGGGFPSGSYQCIGMPQAASFLTGMCHSTCAQGGTGEVNDNGSGETATGYAGNEASPMWTDSRVIDLLTKFGPQYPILTDIGGWNDASLGVPHRTTYGARVEARYDKLFSYSATVPRDIKAINVGIQPVDWTYNDGSNRDLMTRGQADASALPKYEGKVLGHIPFATATSVMWANVGTGGSRSLYTMNQGGAWMHQNISGHYATSAWIFDQVARFKISQDYVRKTLEWVS